MAIMNDKPPPHFVLLPFLAQGHLLPMVDIAKLLAKRGVAVSLLVTPHSFNRVKKVVDRAIASGLSIRVFHLSLPCAAAGLPKGCENFDMLPSMHYVINFFNAIALMKDQVEALLLDLDPTCLIADMCITWATEMALQLKIPRLVFHGTSCFSQLCLSVFRNSKVLEEISDDREYFIVPDLPGGKIEITKAQLRGTAEEFSPELTELRRQIFISEDGAAGTVANTFHDLEAAYVSEYTKISAKKVWCIGPVSLCNEYVSDKAERGSAAVNDGRDCLKWLDLQEPESVIYVCLGSISRMSTAQLKEMGLGLEASNRPFVWVIREATDEFEAWLTGEIFEERLKGRGLLIRGWAPQVLILSHPSLGGFMTHCGWNSTLEGVAAGLPMTTWPVFAEQFCNEKFVVSVIRTGVRVGVEVPVLLGMAEGTAVQVGRDEVRKAIEELMEGGGEGGERRERARKLGEASKRAVVEGGSSNLSVMELIQDMVVMKEKYGGEVSAHATKLDEISSQIVVQ